MPADIPFGFGPPGGELPDPSDPQQMRQFLSHLQQMFAAPSSGGPVNWDLARQVAQAQLAAPTSPGGRSGPSSAEAASLDPSSVIDPTRGGADPAGATGSGDVDSADRAGPDPTRGTGSAPAGSPPSPRDAADGRSGGVTHPGQFGFGSAGPAKGSPTAPGDPAVTPAERNAAVEALRLADLWLQPESVMPSTLVSTVAWSRGEWLNATLDVWRKLCDPVAERMVVAMTGLVPEEAKSQLGGLASMLTSLGGALFGGQLGTALGSLAAEVLSAGDIGLPLGPPGVAALVPANVGPYGQGLEIAEDQVRLYVALREAAHQRLFGHVPWLRGHVLAAVETYAAGIQIDREAIESALSSFDPTSFDPSMLDLTGDNPQIQQIAVEGIFQPADTPQQKASLARLETVLALVEGWVCHVVERAAGQRLPDAVRLAEAFRRRRATGGPAEQTFAALVGLQLRPRRLREATALWAALTEHRGVEGRDALWEHPDLLPDEEAFADPQTFAKTQLDLGDLGFGL